MAKVMATVDDDVKAKAAALYESMGMSLSTAINVFLRQSVNMHGMPFTPNLPVGERQVDWNYEGLNRPTIVNGAIAAELTEYDPEEDIYDDL